jgi:hypothetical protein
MANSGISRHDPETGKVSAAVIEGMRVKNGPRTYMRLCVPSEKYRSRLTTIILNCIENICPCLYYSKRCFPRGTIVGHTLASILSGSGWRGWVGSSDLSTEVRRWGLC